MPQDYVVLQVCNSIDLESLRQRNKGPASNCADGNLSGPSAQHEDKTGKQDRHRHMIAVGIGRAMPTVAVGTSLAVGIDIARPSAQPMPSARPSAQIFVLLTHDIICFHLVYIWSVWFGDLGPGFNPFNQHLHTVNSPPHAYGNYSAAKIWFLE
jgi:hypothetical protein